MSDSESRLDGLEARRGMEVRPQARMTLIVSAAVELALSMYADPLVQSESPPPKDVQ